MRATAVSYTHLHRLCSAPTTTSPVWTRKPSRTPAMPSVTPFFKVCFRVTGMVAADDDERYHKAQKLAEDAVEGEKRSDGDVYKRQV